MAYPDAEIPGPLPNGPNYSPMAEGVGFGGVVLAQPSAVPPITAKDGKQVSFYLAVPAYQQEIEYKLKYGMEELGKLFSENKMPLVLDPHRPNYCQNFTEILDGPETE